MSIDEAQAAAEDAKFERLLLDSARMDALPTQDVERALQRFAATLGLASLEVREPPGLARAAQRALLRWLAVGAVGTGLLGAAWFGFARPAAPNSAPHLASAPPAAGAATPSASPGLAPVLETPRSPSRAAASSEGVAARRGLGLRSESSGRGQRKSAGVQRVGSASTESDGPRELEASSPKSTLLAEVALLDSARAKLALHDPAGALNLLERYEREFPGGQLSTEASVLTMEALAGTEERAELTRRAHRFLEQSPTDPHAPEVRRLLAR
jgi:hypothetical protein